jgi:hypothetical protein
MSCVASGKKVYLDTRFKIQILRELSSRGHHDWPVKPVVRAQPDGSLHSPVPGGEQLRRYSSVTVCRGVCLTKSEETQP